MGGNSINGMGANNGPNNGGGNYNFGGNSGGEQCEVFVPKLAVGVVIGKGGDMIRKIQQECGCKLQFLQGKNDEPGDRRCIIQGTRQQVDDAKRMIDGLIDNVMQRNRNGNGPNSGNNADNGNSNYGYGYGVNHAQQPAREEITFMVPASKCGIVIGRGGETIKLINQQSGAYCEMDRNAVNPPSEKLFKCKGTSDQVEAARQMIAEKINMELPIINRKSINGGPPNQQGGGAGGYNLMIQMLQRLLINSNGLLVMVRLVVGEIRLNKLRVWVKEHLLRVHNLQITHNSGLNIINQWECIEAEMIEQQLKAKQTPAAPQPQAQPAAQSAANLAANSHKTIAHSGLNTIEALPSSASTAASSSSASAAGSVGSHTPSGVSSGGTSSAVAVGGQQSKDYSAQWAEYYRSIEYEVNVSTDELGSISEMSAPYRHAERLGKTTKGSCDPK
ncbi:Far upstream element-binding protein 3 [Eumeta japonica]|uniref:Far upstream element-binding protein 3 n=1 Tax=Eumeta variegata TaxID=151549 RepID=A0A4C1TMW1_EUMVA|nr:Far upstream element-binding protein 3 [Eumeta japonica]